MLNIRIVGKQSNGDFVVRPIDDSKEELELLVKQRKTLLTAQAFNPNKVNKTTTENRSRVD